MPESRQSMYITIERCSDCGEQLHMTNLTNRKFCRNCWEYKDIIGGKIICG